MSSLDIFLSTFNTNLQGAETLEQDLHEWLLPTLYKTTVDRTKAHIPDIYVIAVQELLPLHLALAGLSQSVLALLTSRIQSLLTSHATESSGQHETFRLVSMVSHVGVAVWVFARAATLGSRLGRVQETALGLGFQPLGMGNKGAVGSRVFIDRGEQEACWESFTFISAHFEAHHHNLELRNANYQSLLKGLVFPAVTVLERPTQLHETSHLFILGDLNYRLLHLPQAGIYPTSGNTILADELLAKERAELVSLDTLRSEQRAGRVFGGLREGELERFAPTYKRINGQVEGYSHKRIPGYTDRILFASHDDASPVDCDTRSLCDQDRTEVLYFSSAENIVLSDHKPVHAIIRFPRANHSSPSPHLAPRLPPPPTPHPSRPPPISPILLLIHKMVGMLADRLAGWTWCLLVVLGAGNLKIGLSITLSVLLFGLWWSNIIRV